MNCGPNMVELDRATHTYSNGLPSVTEILRSAGLIDPTWYTDEARQRGTAVHSACEFYDQNDLDLDSLDPQIAGYVKAYIRFREMQDASPEWIEIPLSDKTESYAGTPDRVFITRPRSLVDLKSGSFHPSHKFQLAAYVNMLDDPFSYSRFGLYLKENGSFSVREFPKSEYVQDLGVFMAALTIHNAKMINKIK
jgi:hypothetical protein